MQPFVLTTNELPKYFIRYLGREQLDEISTYAFAVKPKKMEAGKRYFEGEVWVDDRDLQIVKSYGRGEGAKQAATINIRSLKPIASRWTASTGSRPTPSRTPRCISSDNDQRMRMTVKYEDYKQFKSDMMIKYDVDDPEDSGAGHAAEEAVTGRLQ